MSKPPRNIYARVLDVVLAAICVLSAAVLACAMAWPETVGNLNVGRGYFVHHFRGTAHLFAP